MVNKTAQKQIGQDDQSKWEDAIFRDLDYIKQHKRYKWNAKLRTPLLVYSGLLLLIALLLATSFAKLDSEKPGRIIGQLTVPLVSFFIFGIGIFKYLQSLKFDEITTGLSKQFNKELLLSFLNDKHLLVYYHPKTADVVQIISRSINPPQEQREVLVFVLNENSILINSHITDSGWKPTPAARHGKAMGRDLMLFVANNKNRNERSVSSRH